jgi:beta-lactamase class D
MFTRTLSPAMRWRNHAVLFLGSLVCFVLMGFGACSFAEAELSLFGQKRSCFLVKEGEHLKIEEGECQTRYSPSSSFKIPLSLMGFDSEILKDLDHPVWPYQEGYVSWLPSWKMAQTPKSWIKNSCLWYSQQLTQKLGMAKFKRYITQFSYGNQDISGEPGQNNGLTHSWLSSSLQISPKEQLIFLEKLHEGQLAVSLHAVQMTREVLYSQTLSSGWKIYGKTGSGHLLSHPLSTSTVPIQHGWFVGFAENNDRVVYFVNHQIDDKPEPSYAGPRVREVTLNRLKLLLQNR